MTDKNLFVLRRSLRKGSAGPIWRLVPLCSLHTATTFMRDPDNEYRRGRNLGAPTIRAMTNPKPC